MIKRTKKIPKKALATLSGVRVESLCKAYDESIGVDMFCQEIEGEITAFFGGIDHAYSLYITENADFCELDSYFTFCKAMVFSDSFECLQLKAKTVNKAKIFMLPQNPFNNESVRVSASKVYPLLKNGLDGDIVLADEDAFYCDLCIRFNHGAADYATNDFGVAVAGFVTEKAAIITGVAVDKENRNRGNGSRCLNKLLGNIGSKHPDCCIFAITESAAEFYIKNGFKNKGDCFTLNY